MSTSEFLRETVAATATQLGRPPTPSERKVIAREIEAEHYEDDHSPYEVSLALEPALTSAAAKRVRVGTPQAQVFDHNWSTPLALLYANIAAEQPNVMKFRSENLSGKLIKVDDVERWIEDRQDWKTPKPPLAGETIKFESLAYILPDDEWVRRIAVLPYTTLDRLRIVSSQVADDTNWDKATATVWILCGAIPRTPAIQVDTKQAFLTPFGNRQRIVLDVDADVTPEEVKSVYARERSNCFTHTAGTKTRRPLKPRTLRIVASVFGTDWRGWAFHQRQWNDDNPSDQITDIRTFRKLVNRAMRHLLNTKAHLPSKDT
jgi:hypothetical protein